MAVPAAPPAQGPADGRAVSLRLGAYAARGGDPGPDAGRSTDPRHATSQDLQGALGRAGRPADRPLGQETGRVHLVRPVAGTVPSHARRPPGRDVQPLFTPPGPPGPDRGDYFRRLARGVSHMQMNMLPAEPCPICGAPATATQKSTYICACGIEFSVLSPGRKSAADRPDRVENPTLFDMIDGSENAGRPGANPGVLGNPIVSHRGSKPDDSSTPAASPTEVHPNVTQ